MNKKQRLREKRIAKEVAAGTYEDPAKHYGASVKTKRKKLRRKARSKEATSIKGGEASTKGNDATPVVFDPEQDMTPAAMKSQSERMGILFHALHTSVEIAAEAADVTVHTIYRWFNEEGGLAEIKAYVASKTEVSFHRMIDLFLQDLPSRMADLDNEEYFETFRKMLDSAEKAGLFRDRPGSGIQGAAGRSSGNGEKDIQGNGPNISFHITPVVPPPEAKDEDKAKSEAKEEDMPSVFDE